MTVKSTISHVKKVIPEWISEDHLQFVELLETYYKWAESGGQWLDEAKQLMDNYNYELIKNDKLFVYKDVFLRLIPLDNPDMIRSLLKFSKVFYSNRGNLESYEFLFKLLWGEDLQIEFPSDFILRSSDGEWVRETLLCVAYNGESADVLLGKRITGKKSGATAFVNDFNTFVSETGKLYSNLSLISISGQFEIDENIIIDSESNNPLLLNVTGLLGNYRIIDGGAGYLSGTIVPITDPGDGHKFEVIIGDVDSNGKILNLNVSPGVGYVYKEPTIDLESDDIKDFTLEFKPARIEFIKSATFNNNGHYRVLRSALSDKWVLRDGHYYQEYSYAIKSTLKFDTVYRPVIDLLHPAGTVFWFKSDNDYTNIGSDTKILFHDTTKALTDAGIDVNNIDKIPNLAIIDKTDIDANTGKLITSKTYSFDTDVNLDDRVYFSYEKILTSIIDEQV